MADRSIADLHPGLQPLAQKFLDACHAAGVRAFLTETFRSWAEQDADYAKGRTEPGRIITNARGGESPHNFTIDGTRDGVPAARAFDFGILSDDDNQCDWDASDANWQKAIAIGEGLGLVSGSTWHGPLHDNPHMELPNWRNRP